MAQDTTAPLWSFGNSLIRVHSDQVHLNILYTVDVKADNIFRAKC